jgi:hypothetical protein
MTIHPTNATKAACAEAYREGLRMAAGDVSRQTVNKMAEGMPVREGDAFLAGYYAELRRLRNYVDLER